MQENEKKMRRIEEQPDDRRTSLRFPMSREVRHHGLGIGTAAPGCGETVNISSRGVLFTTQERLRRGDWLELCISWPAQLNQQIGLQLVARGPVVRLEDGKAAVAIQQHEFRTQAKPNGLRKPETVNWPSGK